MLSDFLLLDASWSSACNLWHSNFYKRESPVWPAMFHHLGRVVATAAVAFAVPHSLITALLDRHAAGDWGDLDADDKAANEEAARTGDGRLFSSYSTADHGTIWVITNDIRGEGDGPITTVLFPNDY